MKKRPTWIKRSPYVGIYAENLKGKINKDLGK